MIETVAVVLAGGRGTRMGAGRNKVLLELDGRALLDWSIAAFAQHPSIDRTVLVVHPDDLGAGRRLAAAYGAEVITGGDTRPASERRALQHLRVDITAGTVSGVLIHDGARPLVSADLITRVAAEAAHRGVLPVLPAPPLLDRRTLRAPERGRLVRAQTPQGAPGAVLLAAYDDAREYDGTDTVSYLERFGAPVVAVPGDLRNLKVTYPQDLARAHALCAGR